MVLLLHCLLVIHLIVSNAFPCNAGYSSAVAMSAVLFMTLSKNPSNSLSFAYDLLPLIAVLFLHSKNVYSAECEVSDFVKHKVDIAVYSNCLLVL